MSEIQWLYVKDVAERAGISPHDFRTRVSRGHAPKPDDDGSRVTLPDGSVLDIPPNRRMPKWRADGRIAAWFASLPARRRQRTQPAPESDSDQES